MRRIILYFIPAEEFILKPENWDFCKQLCFYSFACMVHCKAPESCHLALTYFGAHFIFGWELWQCILPQDGKKCPSLGLNHVSHRGTGWGIGLKWSKSFALCDGIALTVWFGGEELQGSLGELQSTFWSKLPFRPFTKFLHLFVPLPP